MGEDMAPRTPMAHISITHQERILSHQLIKIPQKDSNLPGLCHMITPGPITLTRSVESSCWLSLGHVPRAARNVFLEERGRGCYATFSSEFSTWVEKGNSSLP